MKIWSSPVEITVLNLQIDYGVIKIQIFQSRGAHTSLNRDF